MSSAAGLWDLPGIRQELVSARLRPQVGVQYGLGKLVDKCIELIALAQVIDLLSKGKEL